MNGWGAFFLVLFLIVVFGALGYVGWTQYRARSAGLPPPSWKSYIPFLKSDSGSSNYPSPRSAGPIEWIKDKIAQMQRKRTAAGAYEGAGGLEAGNTAYAGAGRRSRGVDPDEAWDTRVGNEADMYAAPYEEQELETQPYGGAGHEYGGSSLPAYGDGERGRSRSRDGDMEIRYEQETGGRQQHLGENPFGDQHEAASMRDVSPRPHIDTQGIDQGHSKGKGSHDDSPTERRSVFREGI
ncbi:MAG: hypothetical protein Q9227_005482 [Pyrenula ochraceoflavens]